MSKTIMISDEMYNNLKKAKGSGSFTILLKDLLALKKKKNGDDILKFVGILKGDTEYEAILKDLKKRWAEWTKRYA